MELTPLLPLLAFPSKRTENMRFNDGKVSPQGSLVVGRMHSKWRDGQRGRLYRLDPGSRCAWGDGCTTMDGYPPAPHLAWMMCFLIATL